MGGGRVFKWCKREVSEGVGDLARDESSALSHLAEKVKKSDRKAEEHKVVDLVDLKREFW